MKTVKEVQEDIYALPFRAKDYYRLTNILKEWGDSIIEQCIVQTQGIQDVEEAINAIKEQI